MISLSGLSHLFHSYCVCLLACVEMREVCVVLHHCLMRAVTEAQRNKGDKCVVADVRLHIILTDPA